MYSKTTKAVQVRVRPVYLSQESSPTDDQYVWAYEINLENRGGETVQLLNRYWRIINADGTVQEVQGPGVIGEQPVLRAGQNYVYSSFTVLNTSKGSMVGSYEMQKTETGEKFEVFIPEFRLELPCRLVSVQ